MRLVEVHVRKHEDFKHVDVSPEAAWPTQDLKYMEASALFPAWSRGQKEEIIVAPETVDDLMKKIRAMQEPELRQIRERNRLRDARKGTTEVRHAQIISFAA